MTEAIAKPGHIVMHELKLRAITVAGVEQLTDRYVRIRFTGDDLADFTTVSAEDHVKLVFFSDPDAPLPAVDRGERGWNWPAGNTPELRDYTPRSFDPESRTLVIDFVLHGDGVASNWAAQAKPGQHLYILGPRGSYVLDQKFDWYLLIGDETVIPSIQRHLEAFDSGTRVVAVIEVNNVADQLPMPTRADARIVWVHRGTNPPGGDALERAVRSTEFPEGSVFVFAGGEATSLRGVRRYLRNERSIPVEYLSFSGHWKVGESDFDHHSPIED